MLLRISFHLAIKLVTHAIVILRNLEILLKSAISYYQAARYESNVVLQENKFYQQTKRRSENNTTFL